MGVEFEKNNFQDFSAEIWNTKGRYSKSQELSNKQSYEIMTTYSKDNEIEKYSLFSQKR